MSIWGSIFHLWQREPLIWEGKEIRTAEGDKADRLGAPYADYEDPETGLNTDGTPESLARLPRGGSVGVASSGLVDGLYRFTLTAAEPGDDRVWLSGEQVTAMRDALTTMLEFKPGPGDAGEGG